MHKEAQSLNASFHIIQNRKNWVPSVLSLEVKMGSQASVPKPGAEFQVIGAGLSRTGTASFSEALRILLDGPVYHGGTQTTLGKPVEIKSWITILKHWPPENEADRKLGAYRCLHRLLPITWESVNC